MEARPLYIPVVLRTARKERMSAHVARLLTNEVSKQAEVETELIDICSLALPTNDAGEGIKDSGFSSKMDRADGLVIVAPEYNHGYSGLLKHVLDSCLKEYIHKAVGIVGVSAGPFGGSRVVENLLPVMRENTALDLYQLFRDPHPAFDARSRQYSFMTIGPVSPLSFSGTPLFLNVFNTPEEFLAANDLGTRNLF